MPGHVIVGPHHQCPSCGRSFGSEEELSMHVPECAAYKTATPSGQHRHDVTDEERENDGQWKSVP